MSNNNVINEKKKALLAYKEKILHEIKYYEKSIDDFRSNHKNKKYYDDHNVSSDSEDDFTSAIDMGPTITMLKLQQAMMKTCLHATQELTSLMVLQSEVDVLVEEPKFEGERPVTEAGTWREITAECRIDLVPFTMTFFMHTPSRKFAPPSYRGLRVVPVKAAHEMELTKSVLHSIKVPSDAVEVLRSYAAGYRSRRTTLARLANKYTNALFMEPHSEGGFVLKCADLLEVSWRLENKWSPVAPFHHRMKFDLEFMEESFIKIITLAHKQLLDPALQTDERTLLLAKIITTCLEARGHVDPESDLESKTTDRDNDVDKRDIETERRDSEVMAPPKSLPRKGKQKNNNGSLPNTAQKRSMNDENGDFGAKKLKSDAPESKKSIVDSNNPRKSKMSDVFNEGGKRRKINEVNKVAISKNVQEAGNIEDGNTKSKNVKDSDDKTVNTNSKQKNLKESASTEDKNTNARTKNKIVKGTGNTAAKDINTKPKAKVLKEPASVNSNAKPETKIDKETDKNQGKDNDHKLKEKITKDNVHSKSTAVKKVIKETTNAEKVKNNVNKAKNKPAKDVGNTEEGNQNENDNKTKATDKKNLKTVASKENIATKEDAVRPKIKTTEKPTNTNKNIEANANKIIDTPITTDPVKVKSVATTKNDDQKSKKAKNKPTEVAGNPGNDLITEDNQNENDTNTKSTDKKKLKIVANTKSKENIVSKEDVGRPKSKIVEKSTNTNKNIVKDTDKIVNTQNNPESVKAKNVTSAKNDDQKSKKAPVRNNVASAKKDDQPKKAPEKTVKTKEKVSEVVNKDSEKPIQEKTVKTHVKTDAQTVKKLTVKNATNLKNKDKISPITTKVTEKIVTDNPVPLKEVPKKVSSSNVITKKPKETTNTTNNVIKKPIMNKIASHRNSLKPQNLPKIVKAASTGNTDKENGGKGSKIPQKKLSAISEGSSKKNLLRISPRKIPSKFKTASQETFKQKMAKSTNIPRLLKKPAPKTT